MRGGDAASCVSAGREGPVSAGGTAPWSPGDGGQASQLWSGSSSVVLVILTGHVHSFSPPASWHVSGKPETGQEPSLLAFRISEA